MVAMGSLVANTRHSRKRIPWLLVHRWHRPIRRELHGLQLGVVALGARLRRPDAALPYQHLPQARGSGSQRPDYNLLVRWLHRPRRPGRWALELRQQHLLWLH